MVNREELSSKGLKFYSNRSVSTNCFSKSSLRDHNALMDQFAMVVFSVVSSHFQKVQIISIKEISQSYKNQHLMGKTQILTRFLSLTRNRLAYKQIYV